MFTSTVKLAVAYQQLAIRSLEAAFINALVLVVDCAQIQVLAPLVVVCAYAGWRTESPTMVAPSAPYTPFQEPSATLSVATNMAVVAAAAAAACALTSPFEFEAAALSGGSCASVSSEPPHPPASSA